MTRWLLVLLLPLAAIASDERRAVGNASSADAAAAVSNESRALGLGGSDVDIAEGYRSYSVLFGLYQDTKVNPLAIAGQLAAEGRYREAAVLRCYPRTVHKALGGMDACVAKLSRPPEDEAPAFHMEQQQAMMEQRQAVEVLRAEVERLQSDLDNQPEATERTVIQRQPFLSEKQRAALAEVLTDE